jgi:hypothetical protein
LVASVHPSVAAVHTAGVWRGDRGPHTLLTPAWQTVLRGNVTSTPPISEPEPESSAQSGFSWLSAHAISLAMVAGLLVIVGMVLGTGITGYPAMAADEGNYLEQAWAINHDALSRATSWCDSRRLGWIELWLVANLVGPAVGRQSAGVYGQILMVTLAGAVVLYVLAARPPVTHKKLVALVQRACPLDLGEHRRQAAPPGALTAPLRQLC